MTNQTALLTQYGRRYKFKDATRNQVAALRTVADELKTSISKAVKYMDASFAFRDGDITNEEWYYIERNA